MGEKSKFDRINSIMQMIGLFFMSISIIYGAIQIKMSMKIHQENLLWNKRIETKRAINENIDKGDLNRVFNFKNRDTPIPIDTVLMKIKENPEIQTQLHGLLNYYERLAAGIRFNIYDEELIKNSKYSRINSNFTIFKEYIHYYQNEHDNTGWCEFENLVDKWDQDH